MNVRLETPCEVKREANRLEFRRNVREFFGGIELEMSDRVRALSQVAQFFPIVVDALGKKWANDAEVRARIARAMEERNEDDPQGD